MCIIVITSIHLKIERMCWKLETISTTSSSIIGNIMLRYAIEKSIESGRLRLSRIIFNDLVLSVAIIYRMSQQAPSKDIVKSRVNLEKSQRVTISDMR